MEAAIPRRSPSRPALWSGAGVLCAALAGAAGSQAALAEGTPADRLPTPRPEPCIEFDADPAEGEYAAPEGLSYEQVTLALDSAIQTALYCKRPPEVSQLHLTYELMVGCDGVVSSIEASDDGGAPETYVACVSAVIAKADFPAHDLPDGMQVTYPVNVAW